MSFYGYDHCRMTTEISVMYGSEKVNEPSMTIVVFKFFDKIADTVKECV